MQRIAKCYWVALKALLSFTDGDFELHSIRLRWNQVVLSWYESTHFELVKLVDIYTFWIGVTEYHCLYNWVPLQILENYITQTWTQRYSLRVRYCFSHILMVVGRHDQILSCTPIVWFHSMLHVLLYPPVLIGWDDVTGWSRDIGLGAFTFGHKTVAAWLLQTLVR